MNEKQLRYICEISKHKGIQGAAEVFGKNSSTLLRALKSCESELGVNLFERTGEGYRPTPEGAAVLRTAREILDSFEDIDAWLATTRTVSGVEGSEKQAVDGHKHSWTENEIRYLLTVREEKNISRASNEMFIAQPSLSQAVLGLEAELKESLFVRTKNGVTETIFGTKLMNRLEHIWRKYRALRMELEEFGQMKKGVVTLGIPLNLGTYLLPLVVPEFHRKYPGIEVRIRENNSRELERLMLGKKIDFCILHLDVILSQVHYETFFDDPFYLVIPQSMKERFSFKQDTQLNKADLQKLRSTPFVMVDKRQKLRLVVDGILEKANIVPDICCTTKSMETAKRLTGAGMGVTFLPKSYLTLYSGEEGIACYRVDESLNSSWKLAVAYPKYEPLSRSSREFLRILKKCLL